MPKQIGTLQSLGATGEVGDVATFRALIAICLVRFMVRYCCTWLLPFAENGVFSTFASVFHLVNGRIDPALPGPPALSRELARAERYCCLFGTRD